MLAGTLVVLLGTGIGIGCAIEEATVPTIEAPRGSVDVGISPGSGILDLSDEQLAGELDRMRSIGASWIRIDLDWSRIEPVMGEPNWTASDRVIEAARRRDLRVIGLLTYTPPWVRPADTTEKHPPSDSDAFARFARAAAERYADQIGVWEVWNEPNSQLFWESGPDPIEYAQLVAVTADELRSIDRDAFILSGGLAPALDRPGLELSPQRFLMEMFDALAEGVIDAVAIHPYSYPADPGDSSKDWNLFAQLPELHQLVSDAEGRSLDLWLTEFGAPFDPGNPERQAEIIHGGLVCAGRWPWAGPLLVYALSDSAADPGNLAFGLFSSDGEARPSADAVARFDLLSPEAPLASPCPVVDQ